MTSGRLFYNVWKTDLRQRAWSLLLGMIVLFLCFPAAYLLTLGSELGTDPVRAEEAALHLLSVRHLGLSVITATAACICAPGGFAWLHKRTGTDYYHSLPVRREILFAAKYVNGILIYLSSLGCSLLLTLLLTAAGRGLTADVLYGTAVLFVTHTAAYLMLYSIALTATFLTGNLPVNILMIGFLYLWGIAARLLRMALMEVFFDTFTMIQYESGILGDYGTILSPLTFYSRMTDTGEGWAAGILTGLLIAVLSSALALFLYRRRPSEATDRALAFSWMRLPFKFLVCVPVSLLGGLFFYSMRKGMVWYVFGMMVFWFLSGIFMEMLTALSFRRGFAHWRSSLVCLAASALALLVFALDLTGYDTYLPRREALASMAVSVYGLDTVYDTYVWQDGEPVYASPYRYRLSRMELTDTNLDAAYELAEASVRALEQRPGGGGMVVRYTLKDGREVYRSYSMYGDEQAKWLAQVYASEEYKQGCFPILTDGEFRQYTVGILYSNFLGQEQEISLTGAEIERLCDALSADILDSALEDVLTQQTGTLCFRIRKNVRYGEYDGTLGQCRVYADYDRTLSVLESLGITARYDPSMVTLLEVYDYDTYNGSTQGYYTYTDPEEIRAILPCLRDRDNSWYYDGDSVYAESCSATVWLESTNGDTRSGYEMWIPDMPEFLLRQLEGDR